MPPMGSAPTEEHTKQKATVRPVASDGHQRLICIPHESILKTTGKRGRKIAQHWTAHKRDAGSWPSKLSTPPIRATPSLDDKTDCRFRLGISR
jgi:hypothetical protein